MEDVDSCVECVASGPSSIFSQENFPNLVCPLARMLPQKVTDKNMPFEVFGACFPEFLLLP